MRTDYNKLVRDNIPEIIERDGRNPIIRVLGTEERVEYLKKKLLEEVNEYVNDGTIEELADLLEVIYSLCNYKGISIEQLEQTRINKANERGSFKKGILLEAVES